jgi:hypothetical protein
MNDIDNITDPSGTTCWRWDKCPICGFCMMNRRGWNVCPKCGYRREN